MGIGKIRLIFSAKIFLIFVWFVYFVIFNTKKRDLFPVREGGQPADYALKKELRKKTKIILVGGSNVSVGLSAKAISQNFQCINLGLFSEYGGVENYLNWLEKGVRCETVVYSPVLFWCDNWEFAEFKDKSFNLEMPPSLISQIYLSLELLINKNLYFNEYGDAVQPYGLGISNYYVDSLNFQRLDEIVVKQIYLNTLKLKRVTKAVNVYLRVPPVYNSGLHNKKLEMLINKRVKILSNAGIKILNTTKISANSYFFQDNLHPSKKGREVFTNELIKCLASELVK